MLTYPDGAIFRNSNGMPWTTDAVNCGFLALQMRMGKEEMKRRGVDVSAEEINAFIPTQSPTKQRRGKTVKKTKAELRAEAKRKLTYKKAAALAPRYSLYAIRHSWATNALQKGLDALTVAILLGHADPSTLAKVYQHLSLNPQHLLQQAKRAQGDVLQAWTGDRLPCLLPVHPAAVERSVDVLFTEPNGAANLQITNLLLQLVAFTLAESK